MGDRTGHRGPARPIAREPVASAPRTGSARSSRGSECHAPAIRRHPPARASSTSGGRDGRQPGAALGDRRQLHLTCASSARSNDRSPTTSPQRLPRPRSAVRLAIERHRHVRPAKRRRAVDRRRARQPGGRARREGRARLSVAGLEPEHRALHPHVTIARYGRHERAAPATSSNASAASSRPFAVDRFILFESRLSRHGAHYDEVVAVPLR